MNYTVTIVAIIQLLFTVTLIGIELWALFNSLRFPAAAYDAAFKRTKGFWAAMTGGALFVGLVVGFGPGFGLFSFILEVAALVVAGVFLADVLPALRSVMGRAQGNYGRSSRR